jgi:hypothetical protein
MEYTTFTHGNYRPIITISGWYEEVYEPVFSNNAAQPSAPEGEPDEGEVNPDE